MTIPEIEDDDDLECDTPDEEAQDESDNDPLRTSDPFTLCRLLSDKLRELRDRREAQDLIDEGEKLIAELKRDPAERRAEKERVRREKAARRAAREVPQGTKSAMRAIGRYLARCEDVLEDLMPEDGERKSLEERTKMALAAARLASAASSLGNAMSTNAKTRAMLARTKPPKRPGAPGEEAEPMS